MKSVITLLILAISVAVVNAQSPFVQITLSITERKRTAVRASGYKFWFNKPSQGSVHLPDGIYGRLENVRTLFYFPNGTEFPLHLGSGGVPSEGQQCYVASDGSFSFVELNGTLPADMLTATFRLSDIGEIYIKPGKSAIRSSVCPRGKQHDLQVYFLEKVPANCTGTGLNLDISEGASYYY